jgi:uncharacterized protein (DUF427 family)
MKAIWNNAVIADSADTVIVATTSVCPWKGTASYYSLKVNGSTNQDAVWYYPDPKPAAAQIRDRVAFWKGVKVAP